MGWPRAVGAHVLWGFFPAFCFTVDLVRTARRPAADRAVGVVCT